MSEQEQDTAADDIGTIETIDQFAYLMASWFDLNHAQLRQALEVPEGQSLTIQLDKNAPMEELVLTGEAMKGFKAGMIVATNIFGKLPFGAVPAEPEATATEEAPVNETVVASEAELAKALAKKDEPASPQ